MLLTTRHKLRSLQFLTSGQKSAVIEACKMATCLSFSDPRGTESISNHNAALQPFHTAMTLPFGG
jgi:hypothetical protein